MKPSTTNNTDYIQQLIREVPDYPKPGILFYDITPLLRDVTGLQVATEALIKPFLNSDIDLVIGMEARGFIFGALAAHQLQKGFIPIRKPNKLPAKVNRTSYSLEYGEASLEIHQDAISPGNRVLIVDDLLATGGTAQATIELIEALGGEVVALTFLIELQALMAREKLSEYVLHSVLKY